MDSSRLPNKASSYLSDRPLVQWCIDAVKKVSDLEPILVTSDRDIDDPLVELAAANDIKSFRGSIRNVAKRVYDCIKHFDIDYFARINGDSPFINVGLTESALQKITKEDNLDFVTNLLPRSYPYGLSVEIFDASVFCKYFDELNTEKYQEHITSWFYENSDKIKYYNFENESGDFQNLKCTIDTQDDHDDLEQIIKTNPHIDFNLCDINTLINVLKKQQHNYD